MDNNSLKFLQTNKWFYLADYWKNHDMTTEELVIILKYFNAFWKYEGVPKSDVPHALLASGLHSNGFISCKDVLKFPLFTTIFAQEIVRKIALNMVEDLYTIDVVASSAYSAINLGWEVARLLSEYNSKIEYRCVEKDIGGHPTIIRGDIKPQQKVLIVNELMTTGYGSTWETKAAVLVKQPLVNVYEQSFVLVHRSKGYNLKDESPVVPVFHFDIENFTPDECPYCKAGSKAIKPKEGDNWQRLHRQI